MRVEGFLVLRGRCEPHDGYLWPQIPLPDPSAAVGRTVIYINVCIGRNGVPFAASHHERETGIN